MTPPSLPPPSFAIPTFFTVDPLPRTRVGDASPVFPSFGATNTRALVRSPSFPPLSVSVMFLSVTDPLFM